MHVVGLVRDRYQIKLQTSVGMAFNSASHAQYALMLCSKQDEINSTCVYSREYPRVRVRVRVRVLACTRASTHVCVCEYSRATREGRQVARERHCKYYSSNMNIVIIIITKV